MTAVRRGVRIVPTAPLSEVIERVVDAERAGIDGVWIADDTLMARDLYPTLAACARATSKIILGAAATDVTTRHVTVTACGFATLDEMFRGRFALGLGNGAHTLRALGLPVPRPAEVLEQAEVIRALLAGQTLGYAGKDIRTRFVDAARPAAVPIFVAAVEPEDVQRVVPSGMGVLVCADADGLDAALRAARDGADRARVPVIWFAEPGLSWDQAQAIAQPYPDIQEVVSVA